MNKTDGSIIDGQTEEVLLTYSEEEKQQQEINAANADLVFAPKFIPFYWHIKKKYSLTHVETLLFGFIDFYLSEPSDKRFYFTNEQLAKVLDCSIDTVKIAVPKLRDKGLIETSYRVKAGGGKIRFISRRVKNPPSEGGKITRRKVGKLPDNNNKIKDNKINNVFTTVNTQKRLSAGNEDINTICQYFLITMGIPKEDMPQRLSRRYWHLLLNESRKGLEGVKWLIDIAAKDIFYRHNITSSKSLYYNRIKLISRLKGGSHGTGKRFAVIPADN